MAHKYLVDLTEAEQAYLLKLIQKGKPSARKVARAQVLLHAAEEADRRRDCASPPSWRPDRLPPVSLGNRRVNPSESDTKYLICKCIRSAEML